MRTFVAAVALLLAACGSDERDASTSVDIAQPKAAVAATRNVVEVAPANPSVSNTAPALPADLVAFRKRRDACDHLRGEEAYDAERAASLREGLERSCTGTDADLRALRERYSGNSAVMAALADYEDDVE